MMKAKLREGMIFCPTPAIVFDFIEVPRGWYWGMKIPKGEMFLEGANFKLEFMSNMAFSHFNNSLYKIYRDNNESKD
jgi:hypothetical protein